MKAGGGKTTHTSKLSLSPFVYICVVNVVSINLIVDVTVWVHDVYVRHTGKSGHACLTGYKLALYYIKLLQEYIIKKDEGKINWITWIFFKESGGSSALHLSKEK